MAREEPFGIEEAHAEGLAFAETADLAARTPLMKGGGPGTSTEVGPIFAGRIAEDLNGILMGATFVPAAGSDAPVPARRKRGGATSYEKRKKLGKRVSVMMTMVPETVPFMPLMTVRDDEPGGFADALLGPGGLLPLYKEVEFESIAFNKRYRVGYARNADEVWVRELFSPTFLDHLAEGVPEGCYFELMGGYLLVTVEGPPTTREGFERIRDFGAMVVERLRSETLESEGLKARKPLDDPPEPKGKAGFLVKLIPGARSDLRKQREFNDFLRAHAAERGLELTAGQGFVLDNLRLRIPGGARAAMRGTLADGTQGELLALDFGHQQAMPGVYLPLKRNARRPALQIWPGGGEHMMLGGLPVEGVEGLAPPPDEEPPASEELREGYTVIVGSGTPKAAKRVADKLETGLLELDPEQRVFVSLHERGILIAGRPRPTTEWSAEHLDAFIAEAVELVAPLA